jgi:hypothetical protein
MESVVVSDVYVDVDKEGYEYTYSGLSNGEAAARARMDASARGNFMVKV